MKSGSLPVIIFKTRLKDVTENVVFHVCMSACHACCQQVPDDRSTGYFAKEQNWVSVF